MLERRIRISNQLGIHARAAAKLVRLVGTFESTVTLSHGGTTVDAGSILDLMALAVGYGNYVHVVVNGVDEIEATRQIERLFSDRFGEH